jgi:hypothetical protein
MRAVLSRPPGNLAQSARRVKGHGVASESEMGELLTEAHRLAELVHKEQEAEVAALIAATKLPARAALLCVLICDLLDFDDRDRLIWALEERL